MKNSRLLTNIGKYSNEQRKIFMESAIKTINNQICSKYKGLVLTNQIVNDLKQELLNFLNDLNMTYNDLLLQSYLKELKNNFLTFKIRKRCIVTIEVNIDFKKLFLYGVFNDKF